MKDGFGGRKGFIYINTCGKIIQKLILLQQIPQSKCAKWIKADIQELFILNTYICLAWQNASIYFFMPDGTLEKL